MSNYTKHDWVTGEVITEALLDHIEDGLADHTHEGDEITLSDGQVTTDALADGAVTTEKLDDSAVIGTAEQLASSVYTVDQEPYNFRTSGGSADIGNRKTDMVVGGSVIWNQFVDDTLSAWRKRYASVANSGSTITITSTSSNTGSLKNVRLPVSKGHVIMVIATLATVSATSGGAQIGLYEGDSGSSYASRIAIESGSPLKRVIKVDDTLTDPRLAVNMSTAMVTGDYVALENFQVHDLTLMFGTTIADAIYALETATEGAGVAWFKALFPKAYYPYNAGELLSVNVSEHKTVGFNAYNPDTGTANLIGGNQYQITGTYTSLSYTDIDGTAETLTIDSNGLFIPTNNGTLSVTGGGSDTCVHLVWSGYRNGEYADYEEHTYPLDSSLTLRGIPKLDSNGTLYYDGDTYESDGTVTRRYGYIELGHLSWTVSSTDHFFYVVLNSSVTGGKPRKYGSASSGLSGAMEGYTFWGNATSSNLIANLNNMQFGFYITSTAIMVRNDSCSTVEEIKAALDGVYLVYPINDDYVYTETATAYDNPQIVDDFGTEEYTDYAYEQGDRDVAIPCGHYTEYQQNLRDKLQHLPDLASANGDYIIRQTDNQMALVPMEQVKELPDYPTTDGTYTLKVTVSDGTATLAWG